MGESVSRKLSGVAEPASHGCGWHRFCHVRVTTDLGELMGESMKAKGECTFCNLVKGSAEVSICHEDESSIAFMDIQPVNPGHVLVVPRAHYNSLVDVPPEIGAHLFKVTMRLARAVRRVTGSDDMNIVVNSGSAAGQDEPHYHVHIIPRRAGDGFDIPLPFSGSEHPSRQHLDAMAVQILSALRDPMRLPREKWKPESREIAEGPHGELAR